MPLRLVWKCCSVVFKIGSKIFSLQRHFKRQCQENPFSVVLNSVEHFEHHIKINQQDIFSFSMTCIVLQLFNVLKYANRSDVISSREKYYSNQSAVFIQTLQNRFNATIFYNSYIVVYF